MVSYTDALSAMTEIIRSSPSPLLLAEDLAGDWDETIATQALEALLTEQIIISFAAGVYVRTYYNSFLERPTPMCSTFDLGRLYVARLGVRTVPTDKQYAEWRRRIMPKVSYDTIGVSRPIITGLNAGIIFDSVTFEYIPDGLERLAKMGVEDLYLPVDLSSEYVKRFDPVFGIFPS